MSLPHPPPAPLPPEAVERSRHGGSVSPIPTLTPVAVFLEELKAAGAHAKPYEILGPLGKGKFAMVYKAQLGTELYALKKVAIFEMMNQASRDKCLKEIQLLQSLRHQNIIRYEDSYIDLATSELVIVLQWARGGDLKKLIKKVKGGQAKITEFSEGMIWKYAAELANGLEYMHEKRVMHRDLKPANIMLTHDNHVLLGDLGLSRYFNPQTLEAFSKVGTPLYISPEVLMGTGYGFAADVWSLGCILYELCTLSSPFKPTTEGVNLFALFGNIRAGKYEPIPANGKYSENLRALITAMIRIDPNQRPTMQQVAEVARKVIETRMTKQPTPQPQPPTPAQPQSQSQSQTATPAATSSSTTTEPNQSSAVTASTATSAGASRPTSAVRPPSAAKERPSSKQSTRPPTDTAVSTGPPLPQTAATSTLLSTAAPTSPPVDATAATTSPTAAVHRPSSSSSSPSPPVESPMMPPIEPLQFPRATHKLAEPLNASPMIGLSEFPPPRSVSPISPIRGSVQHGRMDSVTENNLTSPPSPASKHGSHTHQPQHDGSARPVPTIPLHSNGTPATATPATPVIRPPSATNRPPSAGRPVSASRPISAGMAGGAPPLHPNSGSGLPPRPTSKGAQVRPTSSSQQQPQSGSLRPGSRERPSSSSRPMVGDQQNGVDHFPSRPSGAGAAIGSPPRPTSSSAPTHPSLSVKTHNPAPSITSSLFSPSGGGSLFSPHSSEGGSADDASDDESSMGGQGERGGVPLAALPSQSFLYDRASPSPTSIGGGSKFTMKEAQELELHAAATNHRGAAHMSFNASPSPTHAQTTFSRPPSMDRTSSTGSDGGRPISRGHSASSRPTMALPMNNSNVTSPPPSMNGMNTIKSPPSSNSIRESADEDEAVESEFPSPPAVVRRSVSETNKPRVKSANVPPSSSHSSFKQSTRLPLDQFVIHDEEGGGADIATNGLHLPPRPVSAVEAPTRPQGGGGALASAVQSTPFPSLDGMMETVLDNLMLLHYETRLAQPASLPWLSRDFFTYDFGAIKDAQEKLAYARSKGKRFDERTMGPMPIAVSTAPSSSFSGAATPTRSQQLLYLAHIIAWFLTLAVRSDAGEGVREELATWKSYQDYRDSDDDETDDRRLALASVILSSLSSVKFSLPILTPADLAETPSGERVLQLLFRLAQAVYYKKLHGSVVINPIAMREYPPKFEPSNGMGSNNGLDNDDDSVSEEDEIEEAIGDLPPNPDDDDPYASSIAASSPPIPLLSESEAAKKRAADAAAWQLEYARVSESSALNINLAKVPTQRDWQRHLEAVKKFSKAVSESPLVSSSSTSSSTSTSIGSSSSASVTAVALTNRACELRRVLERIKKYESSLQRDSTFAPMIATYAEARSKTDAIEQEYTALQSENSALSDELSTLETNVDSLLQQMRDHQEFRTDEQGLRGLRSAITRMRQELVKMNVQSGVKRNLLQHQMLMNQAQVNQKAMRVASTKGQP